MKNKFLVTYLGVCTLVMIGLFLILFSPILPDSKELLQGNYRYVQDGELVTCSFNADGTFSSSLTLDIIMYTVKKDIISFYNPNLPKSIDGIPVLPDYQMKYSFVRGKLFLYDVVIQENPRRVLEKIR